MNYVAGLDLAQSSDYSALVIVEHLTRSEGRQELYYGRMVEVLVDVFHVVHVQRWRGKPYPALVDEVCQILRRPPLREQVGLTIDATGVGRAVMDLFWQALQDGKLDQPAWGITITAGQAQSGGHIPKKDLIAKLVVLFEQGRLKIAEELPLAKEVKAELQEFRSRMHASAHVSFEAPVGKHDDLVLALSLAVYHLRHIGEPSRIAPDGTLYPRLTDAWANTR